MMKKTVLIAVFCAAVLSPVRALMDWTYARWHVPVSWRVADTYYQIGYNTTNDDFVIYIGCHDDFGYIPDSDLGNTVEIPFQTVNDSKPVLQVLPWRPGGENLSFLFKGGGNTLQSRNMNISTLTVDEGINNLGNFFFGGLKSLEKVSLPSTLYTIGNGVFYECTRLYEISIPDNVLSIGYWAFYNCYALKHIKIPPGTFVDNEAFMSSGLESLDFGEGVTFGYQVFWECKNLKRVTIPANYVLSGQLSNSIFLESGLETVTVGDNVTLGKDAFRNCPNLKSVIFQGRINGIAEGAFQKCISLSSISIPNGATSIGSYAFGDCSSLSSISIPNSVPSIGDFAFGGCSSLRSITIPNSVTSIGAWAFGSTGLTSIIIPNSVTHIGEYAFDNSGLTSLIIPGSLKNVEAGVFSSCKALTSVEICEGVKTLSHSVFRVCEKLETVSFPASLDSIGDYVFTDCNSLKLVECNGTTPPAISGCAFPESNITEISVCVPYGSVDAYRNAPVWKNFKNNIGTYPAGIHIINGKNLTVSLTGENFPLMPAAFNAGNTGRKVKLTAKLTPSSAVPAVVWTSSNKNVASVVDGTVTAHAVGEAVITATTVNGIFKDECRITVKPGKNVITEQDIIQEWRNSKHITIPDHCTLTERDGIFANSSLETVTVGDNAFFGKDAFHGCRNLKSIIFQGRINEVTEGMFRGCSSLTSVNIPGGVKSIGNDAFLWSGLTSVTIPNSVTNIGQQAFNNTGLTSIIVPGSVKNIEYSTFGWCGNLTSVKLCEGVKIVGNVAFYNCEKLETVSLPLSLEYMDAWAFGACYSLKVIECNGTTPPAMSPWVFTGSDLTNVTVYVPKGCIDAYKNAPVWKDFKNIKERMNAE